MDNANYGQLSINVTRFLIKYAVRFSFAAILIYSCWAPLKYLTGWFPWHITLCTVAYIPLMAESLMLLVGDELWSIQLRRNAKYRIHGYLMILATVVAIAGNSLAFLYISQEHHFYTIHGITGLASMVLLIFSIPLGLAAYYSEQMKAYLKIRPVWYQFIHNVVGLLAYGTGIASLCYGYYTSWIKYYYDEVSILVVLTVTITASLWSINGALISMYNQIRNIF